MKSPPRVWGRVLRPILKLFFNPNPLIQVLHIQSQLNALEVEAEASRRAREQLTFEVKRNVDVEYLRRAFDFIDDSVEKDTPFFLYYNPTLMHLPCVPRDEYKGTSGNGDWADCLLQLDGDFGALLDKLDALGLTEDLETFLRP